MPFVRIDESKRSEPIMIYATPELKADMDKRAKIKNLSRSSFIIQCIKNELSKEE